MPDRLDYDTTVKYTFEVDRPTLLERLAGGKRVREFLNVEIPTVLKRIADLLIRLDDGELLHLDFQSTNDPRMAHRAGIVGLLLDQKLGPGLALRQVVLYIGADKMSMPVSTRVGRIQVAYELIDIREFDAAELIATGNPGDLALALLARNGPAHLRQILRAAKRLRGHARQRVLVELTVFSGLRHAENRLKMEMKSMELTLDVEKHPILRDILHQGQAQGLAQGRAKGVANGRDGKEARS